jgi:hypothetical protein
MTERKTPRTPMAALKRLVDDLHCNKSAAARRLGVGPQLINDVLSGRRRISTKLAKTLGFRKRVVYEALENATPSPAGKCAQGTRRTRFSA